jgi:hypothetical protein
MPRRFLTKHHLSFEQWKAKVDEVLAARLMGLMSDDLRDVDYRGLYEIGDTPSEAADYAIQNAQES